MRIFPLTVVLVLTLGGAGAAGAVCAPRDQMVERLLERFQETPEGMGLDADARVVELWSSDAGSWSLVVTDARGRACIVAAGEAWQPAPPLGNPA